MGSVQEHPEHPVPLVIQGDQRGVQGDKGTENTRYKFLKLLYNLYFFSIVLMVLKMS